MNQSPRFHIEPRTTMPSDLEELGRRINQLSEADRRSIRPVYDRVLESFRLRTRIMNVAKEALERIRLDMAFLRFDLEATRREKESLEKQMDGE